MIQFKKTCLKKGNDMYYNFNQYTNLGATLEKNGCNFAIYVKKVNTLSLNIFSSSEDTIPQKKYSLLNIN